MGPAHCGVALHHPAGWVQGWGHEVSTCCQLCKYIHVYVSVPCRVLHLEQSKKRRKGAGQEVGHSHQLTLLHACKPHTKPLTCLAVDAEGRMLATGVSELQVRVYETRCGSLHPPPRRVQTALCSSCTSQRSIVLSVSSAPPHLSPRCSGARPGR